MSASISLLRSKRKSIKKLDDSGDESDCSIKDAQKKESIEKDARAIAAINMLTVSMVNKLLEQQGMDPFGKTVGSPSLDDGQSWTPTLKTTSRPSITRSIKENTLIKKSRKSVRFTPDSNRTEPTPDRSYESDALGLTHIRTTPLSALKMEPKFTPLRRSKVLKASMLRSLENELDMECADDFVCSNDTFDSPLPVRNLVGNTDAQAESLDDTPMSSSAEVKHSNDESSTGNQQLASASFVDIKTTSKLPNKYLPSPAKSLCEGSSSAAVSTPEVSVEDRSDNNDLNCETPSIPKRTQHLDPSSPEHMSPFLKTLLEDRAEQNQGKVHSKLFSEDSEDQQKQSILKGVIAYVEVVRADEDRSSGFRWKLKQLGAQVEENFTKKVTHVVFQEGLLSTYRKAKDSNVHLVSAFWVMACDERSCRAPEDKYPIDEEEKYSMLAPLKKYIRRPKLLSPSLADGDDEKRLAKRLQAIKRRSMKIESTPHTESETNETNAAQSSKTVADSKLPMTSKRASIGKKSLGTSSRGSSSLMNAWLRGEKIPDEEKDTEKTQVMQLATESRTGSTSSPRKRTADKSSEELKTYPSGSFDSLTKTKPSCRSVDSPVKTKLSSLAKTKRGPVSLDSPAKKKQSSESLDSPAKSKLRTRTVNSPAKTKLISSRTADSPAKTKLSSGSVHTPSKRKLNSGTVDTPSKRKRSSRIVDSPAKTKLSSKAIESPVKALACSKSFDSSAKSKASLTSKTKSSSIDSTSSPAKKPYTRTVDSSAKTKLVSRSFDSSLKIKSSSELIDYSNSSSAAPTVRSKISCELSGSPKVTPKKRSAKNDRSPARTTSYLAGCSATSEVSGRVLRSTPKKNYAESSTKPSGEQEKNLQMTSFRLPAGKKSLTSWLSGNKASPVKRSLSEAFTDPGRKPLSSALTTIVAEVSDLSASSVSAEVDIKPPTVEAPSKKALADSTHQKVKEAKPKDVSRRPSAKSAARKSVSRASKTPKVAPSGPSRSKVDKKKPSPRGNSARGKCSDKSQTVMTSHFRPVVSSRGDKASPKVIDNEKVVTASVDNLTKQTSCPQISQESETVAPLLCPPFVNTSEVIENVQQVFCPLTDETESIPPAFSRESSIITRFEESRTHKDPQHFNDVNGEQTNTSEVSEETGKLVAVRKPAYVNINEQQEVDMLKTPMIPSAVCEEYPNPANESDVKRTTSDVLEGPMEVADVCEEQTATAEVQEDPIRAAEWCEDIPVTDVFEEPLKNCCEDVCEKQTATDNEQEDVLTAIESCEDKPVTDDALEERIKHTDRCEEQTATGDGQEDPLTAAERCEDKPVTDVQESLKNSDVCEEQTDTGDAQEEPLRKKCVCEDELATDDGLKEPLKTSGVYEGLTAMADEQEDPMRAAVCCKDTPVTDAYKGPVKNSDVCGEQTATDDEQGEPIRTTDKKLVKTTDLCEVQTAPADEQDVLTAVESCENKPVTDDALEERKKISDRCEEQTATGDGQEEPLRTDTFEELVKTIDVCEEQSATADVQEDPRRATESCEYTSVTYNALEEPVKTTAVSENITETQDVSEGRRAIADELVNTADKCEDRTADVLEKSVKSTVLCETRKAATDSLEEQPIAAEVSPDESCSNVSFKEQDCSGYKFPSSQELARPENSNVTNRKRTRNSIKPSNKESHYRTRRSMRFVESNVTD